MSVMRRQHNRLLRCLPALAAPAIAGLCPATVPARTITNYLVSGQIASNSSFTTGVQSVPLTAALQPSPFPAGDFFRFGISAVVTNNGNPVYGDPWDSANQQANGVTQPEYLGLAAGWIQVKSTDTTASTLAPVLGALRPGEPPVITPPRP